MLLLGNLKLLEGYFMGPEHCMLLQKFLETIVLQIYVFQLNIYLVVTHWKNANQAFYKCPKQ